jgi:ATP-dependent protease HslVU (ClpYQ) peptidase subunit
VTTIFASAQDGVMICDSKISSGGTWYPATKVYRINGELVGLAGDCKDGDAWLKWYRSGKKGPGPKGDEFEGLILRETGLYKLNTNAHEILIERGFHGVGSGGGYAVAAFMAKPDALDAVNIACQVDLGSGGAIVVHKLKP